MTWGEFKQRVEALGVRDDDVVARIEWSFGIVGLTRLDDTGVYFKEDGKKVTIQTDWKSTMEDD